MNPKTGKSLEVYVGVDFAGNWDQDESFDRDTTRYRYGYIIMCAGCPLVCKSQLHTDITLYSTESEYTGLSYALLHNGNERA